MRRLLILPALLAALVFAGCFETAAAACEDHGGVKSIVQNGEIISEEDATEGAEAVCNEMDGNDPVEFEYDGSYWSED